VVFVGQDWGGALAMDWARRRPESTRRHFLQDSPDDLGRAIGAWLRSLARSEERDE
jgi:pimeloyl-ACP methyl ester carboxylesterase